MSVTITIANNAVHPTTLDLIKQNNDGEDFVLYPFELNITNTNFVAFFTALRISLSCGSINPLVIRGQLCAVMAGGIDFDHDQMSDCILELLDICSEAEKREENIIWY